MKKLLNKFKILFLSVALVIYFTAGFIPVNAGGGNIDLGAPYILIEFGHHAFS